MTAQSYLRRVLNARVYDVAIESALDPAPGQILLQPWKVSYRDEHSIRRCQLIDRQRIRTAGRTQQQRRSSQEAGAVDLSPTVWTELQQLAEAGN